jgi:hypothetical protein
MTIDWIPLPRSNLQIILQVAMDRNAKEKRAERVRKEQYQAGVSHVMEHAHPKSFSRVRDPLPLSGIV